MFKRSSILPTASDGLAPVQRAILRYLFAEPEPPNCAAIIKGLLASGGFPGNSDPRAITAETTDADVIDADTIDAAILTMSHPALCHAPLLTYHGSFGFEGGWLPGPIYRTVRLSPEVFDLLAEEPSAEDIDAPWATRPLPMRYPIALLHGSASWQLEIDQRVPPEKWEQRERRIRCERVHTLAAAPSAIDRASHRYRQTGDLADCLSRLNEDGPPIGCCPPPVHVADESAPEAEWLKSLVDSGGDTALPHGLLLGYQAADGAHANGPYELISLPVLQYVRSAPSGCAYLIVKQAACGRCVGDEVNLLCRHLAAERVTLSTTARADASIDAETDGKKPLPGVIALPPNATSGPTRETLACHVPLEPLPKEVSATMLA